MPLPIVGGAIVKVGGSILSSVAINAIFDTLSKLRIPKGKVKDIIIDKLIDYAINQVTASTANQPENLKAIRLFEGVGSISLAFPSNARAIKITVTEFPKAYGRRFSKTVPDDINNSLPDGSQAIQRGLIDKLNFGGISFGGSVKIINNQGDEELFSCGLIAEEEITFQNQIFNVSTIGKGNYLTGCLLYLNPFVKVIVDCLYVEEEQVQQGSTGGNNQPQVDPYICIDFIGDGSCDSGSP